MVPNMSGADAHESSVRHGGALELRFLAWAFWHSAANTQARLKANTTVDGALNLGAPSFADWLQRMPIRKGQTQLKLVPPYEKWAFDVSVQVLGKSSLRAPENLLRNSQRGTLEFKVQVIVD